MKKLLLLFICIALCRGSFTLAADEAQQALPKPQPPLLTSEQFEEYWAKYYVGMNYHQALQSHRPLILIFATPDDIFAMFRQLPREEETEAPPKTTPAARSSAKPAKPVEPPPKAPVDLPPAFLGDIIFKQFYGKYNCTVINVEYGIKGRWDKYVRKKHNPEYIFYTQLAEEYFVEKYPAMFLVDPKQRTYQEVAPEDITEEKLPTILYDYLEKTVAP